MGNPIQYRNTDNPSQIGGLATTRGGANHNAFIIMISPPEVYHNDKCVMINPPGAYHNGGVNENLTPVPFQYRKNIFICITGYSE